MKVQVARWGNSTGMRFPKKVVERLGLVPGSQLELLVEENGIRLVRSKPNPPELLARMVAEARRLGPDHEPEALDWGPDRGSEVINDAYSRREIGLEDLMKRRDARRG